MVCKCNFFADTRDPIEETNETFPQIPTLCTFGDSWDEFTDCGYTPRTNGTGTFTPTDEGTPTEGTGPLDPVQPGVMLLIV